MEYSILKDMNERDELKKAASKISGFVKRKKVHTIVALDKSGRPAGLLLSDAYKTLYPNQEPLKVFFLNPGKADFDHKISLKEQNPHLLNYIQENPEEKFLIIDEYARSGETIRRAKNMLTHVGAKKVYSATINAQEQGKKYLFFKEKPEGIDVIGSSKLEEIPVWYGRRYSGVKENDGKSSPDLSYEATRLRKELKSLAGELGKKSRNRLEKIAASIFAIFGLTAMLYQGLSTKSIGAVISTSQLVDATFIVSLILIIISGILFFKSFKR